MKRSLLTVLMALCLSAGNFLYGKEKRHNNVATKIETLRVLLDGALEGEENITGRVVLLSPGEERPGFLIAEHHFEDTGKCETSILLVNIKRDRKKKFLTTDAGSHQIVRTITGPAAEAFIKNPDKSVLGEILAEAKKTKWK